MKKWNERLLQFNWEHAQCGKIEQQPISEEDLTADGIRVFWRCSGCGARIWEEVPGGELFDLRSLLSLGIVTLKVQWIRLKLKIRDLL